MAAQGLAFAYRRYSDLYVATEESAEAAGAGVWSEDVAPPWEWRKKNR